MGLGGISIWQLLIILAIVVMLFGTSRLKNIGSDLGSAIKGFKKSIKDTDNADEAPQKREADADNDLTK
ncbi:MAG: Sec-independent protein translocase subunit TatA [Halieaceae bacterium]|jgi:sec-independent protein translocase protein TatA|nr:Sec-independent protein translocase subunit TatA [Cellvibrionales bacterium]